MRHEDCVEALKAEVERLRTDAARWRWVDTHATLVKETSPHIQAGRQRWEFVVPWSTNPLGEGIDAAIAAEAAGGGDATD